MGLEPTTLCTLDRALYQLSYRGSSAGWAQISHLMYMYGTTQKLHIPTQQLTPSCPQCYCTCTCTCIYIYMQLYNMHRKGIIYRVEYIQDHRVGVLCTCWGSSFFLGKVTTLGVLLCPNCCLFDLVCFFIPSFSSLIKHVHVHCITYNMLLGL